MTKIAIIGAGQLGSRHLQALNLITSPLVITVIDPNMAALAVAKERFLATATHNNHQVEYQQEMLLQGDCDIVIVASSANARCAIIKSLLENTIVKHLILEKLLFTEREHYTQIETLLAKTATLTWVNCCMRMMPFYNKFANIFQGQRLQYNVHGSQYGLVTNAIHYLDHVAFLTGCIDFKLQTDYLDTAIIPSKRSGFYELTGTLIAHFANGSIAYLHCDKEGTAPIQVEMYNDANRIISRESQQQAWITSASVDWQWQEQNAPIPFQSTLTADLINALINTNTCLLTDYKNSSHIHLQLLEPLKAFLKTKNMQCEVDYPFT